jgi:hypothetical protein
MADDAGPAPENVSYGSDDPAAEGWPLGVRQWRRRVRAVPIVAGIGEDIPCYGCPGPGGLDLVPATVNAYRLARAKTMLVRAALQEAGFTVEDDFPGLSPAVDSCGHPAVVLGPVATATAVRLAQLLAYRDGPDGGQAA